MNKSIQFIPVDLGIHRSQLIDLNIEYLNWVVEAIDAYHKINLSSETGTSVQEYVSNNIEKICSVVPCRSIFYLLELDSLIIGMGGVRRIREKVGEIKRMYVKPPYRGKGYGRALLKKLIPKAREFGYEKICLDTRSFMTSAQYLYRSFGFVEREEYPETEAPEQIR